MAATFIWTINYMDTKLQDDGLTNVVVSCQWAVKAVEDSLVASNFGYTRFSPPNSQTFTVYNNLTQEQVLDWVWNTPSDQGGVDKAQLEVSLQEQIDAQKNPPIVILPNPW